VAAEFERTEGEAVADPPDQQGEGETGGSISPVKHRGNSDLPGSPPVSHGGGERLRLQAYILLLHIEPRGRC